MDFAVCSVTPVPRFAQKGGVLPDEQRHSAARQLVKKYNISPKYGRVLRNPDDCHQGIRNRTLASLLERYHFSPDDAETLKAVLRAY